MVFWGYSWCYVYFREQGFERIGLVYKIIRWIKSSAVGKSNFRKGGGRALESLWFLGHWSRVDIVRKRSKFQGKNCDIFSENRLRSRFYFFMVFQDFFYYKIKHFSLLFFYYFHQQDPIGFLELPIPFNRIVPTQYIQLIVRLGLQLSSSFSLLLVPWWSWEK